MKTKPHIFVLLAFLIVAGMIVSPVSATQYTTTGNFDFFKVTERASFSGSNNYSYNSAPNGERISRIQFTVDTGHYVNFTLYYGNGSTVQGSAENYLGLDLCYGYIPCPMTTSTVYLNGVSDTYQYGDAQPLIDFYIAGYGRDSVNQTGFLLYDGQYGNIFGNDLATFYPVSNLQSNLIYRIDISGSQTFSLYIDHGKTKDVAGLVNKSWWDIAQEWIAIAAALSGSAIGFVSLILGLIDFFFIKNFFLVVGLWFGVTMAFSAVTTVGNGLNVRNLERFYTKFFRYQKALLEGVVSLWDILIKIVGALVQMFVKWL